MLFFPVHGGANIPESFGVKVGLRRHILDTLVSMTKEPLDLDDLNQQGALFPQRENPSVLLGIPERIY